MPFLKNLNWKSMNTSFPTHSNRNKQTGDQNHKIGKSNNLWDSSFYQTYIYKGTRFDLLSIGVITLTICSNIKHSRIAEKRNNTYSSDKNHISNKSRQRLLVWSSINTTVTCYGYIDKWGSTHYAFLFGCKKFQFDFENSNDIVLD